MDRCGSFFRAQRLPDSQPCVCRYKERQLLAGVVLFETCFEDTTSLLDSAGFIFPGPCIQGMGGFTSAVEIPELHPEFRARPENRQNFFACLVALHRRAILFPA